MMQHMPIRYMTYEATVEEFKEFDLSIPKLKRAVTEKRLTRFQSSRDRRVTLLNAEEVIDVFGPEALHTPAA